MTYGFKIVQEMISGLSQWMDTKGYRSIEDFRGLATAKRHGLAVPQSQLRGEGRASTRTCASSAGAATSPARILHTKRSPTRSTAKRMFVVKDEECVGCNLCACVCPVDNCITMVPQTAGVDPRTGRDYDQPYANWTTHPNNPMAKVAAE